MGEFYDVSSADDQYTREELDKCALRGGVLKSIGYGYACRGETPAPQHGYGFRWINTGGMGNHGRLILIPRSERAALLIQQGVCAQWATDLGIDTTCATRLYTASRGVSRGRELRVLRAVLEHGRSPAWDSYPGAGGGVWRWADRWCLEFPDLTAPRLDAVHAIIMQLRANGAPEARCS